MPTNPLTDEQIDALEAALAKATEGPWKHVSYCGFDIIGTGDRPREVRNRVAQLCDEEGIDERANGALICLLHNRAPALLSELRSLREQVKPNVATVCAYEAGRQDGMREAADFIEAQANQAQDTVGLVRSGLPISDPVFSCAGLRQIAAAIRTRIEESRDG